MFWLSKPFSIDTIRKCLAFTGLEVTTDVNDRLVVYSIDGGKDGADMLKQVIKQYRLGARLIPCNEQTCLYVRNKLRACSY